MPHRRLINSLLALLLLVLVAFSVHSQLVDTEAPAIHEPRMLVVEILVDENGKIDRDHHADPSLLPGDFIVYECQNADFKVTDIKKACGFDFCKYPNFPFEKPLPTEFTAAGEKVVAGPLKAAAAGHSYKATYVVAKDGKVTDVWDPHFSGHRRRR